PRSSRPPCHRPGSRHSPPPRLARHPHYLYACDRYPSPRTISLGISLGCVEAMGRGGASCNDLVGWAPLPLFLERSIVVQVALGAAVERGAAFPVARQAGFHHRDEHVVGLGAGLGSGVARFAFHFAVGPVGKFAALEPILAVGIAALDSEGEI